MNFVTQTLKCGLASGQFFTGIYVCLPYQIISNVIYIFAVRLPFVGYETREMFINVSCDFYRLRRKGII